MTTWQLTPTSDPNIVNIRAEDGHSVAKGVLRSDAERIIAALSAAPTGPVAEAALRLLAVHKPFEDSDDEDDSAYYTACEIDSDDDWPCPTAIVAQAVLARDERGGALETENGHLREAGHNMAAAIARGIRSGAPLRDCNESGCPHPWCDILHARRRWFGLATAPAPPSEVATGPADPICTSVHTRVSNTDRGTFEEPRCSDQAGHPGAHSSASGLAWESPDGAVWHHGKPPWFVPAQPTSEASDG